MALPGDDVIPGFKGRITFAINIRSNPQEIFPWIKQMGCGRGGWYSYDKLDNGGEPSAREIMQKRQLINLKNRSEEQYNAYNKV